MHRSNFAVFIQKVVIIAVVAVVWDGAAREAKKVQSITDTFIQEQD